MKKIDIRDYRFSNVESKQMIGLDQDVIEPLLVKRGLVWKSPGLCSEPWNMYYSFTHQDPRGVSHSNSSNINVCYVKVNEATSTYSRKKYLYSIHILRTKTSYYLVALAQTSRYNESSGAEHIVYECDEAELDKVLDILFKNVK